jgi:hypothetical protein
MAKMNVWKRMFPARTHEGAVAQKIDAKRELRRTVLTCLLWEDTFYEKGSGIAERMAALVTKNKPEDVAALACEAREAMQLRHAPLFLVRELARRKGAGPLVADALERVIQRADELGEFVALYWKDKKQPLSAGAKRGLARAFTKFDAINWRSTTATAPLSSGTRCFFATRSPRMPSRQPFGRSSSRTRSSLPTRGRLLCPQGRTSARTSSGCFAKASSAGLRSCAT